MHHIVNTNYIPKSRLDEFNRATALNIPREPYPEYHLLLADEWKIKGSEVYLLAEENRSGKHFRFIFSYPSEIQDNKLVRHISDKICSATEYCTGRQIRIKTEK